MHATVDQIAWREDLPDACPPSDASPLNPITLLRLVETDDPQDDAFHSYAKLGIKKRHPGNECAWASCSMILPTIQMGSLQALRKLPNLKSKTHIAKVNVNQQSGKAKIKNTHVDFWMYASFDPCASIDCVIAFEDYNG